MYALRSARSLQSDQHDGTYFDVHFKRRAYKVLPGEYVATREDLMLVTVLGSCVAACIRDPLAGVGGMNHFMLPEVEFGSTASPSARYGSYAMETLINALLKQGARRERLEAKVFGGGAVLRGFTAINVGQKNADFVLDYLATEKVRIVAQDLCGTSPRRVHYLPLSGQAFVRALPVKPDTELASAETLYLRKLREEPASGSVELF